MSNPTMRTFPESTASARVLLSVPITLLIMSLGPLLLLTSSAHAVDSRNHDFVLGYATAVIERAESQQTFVIDYEAGVIRVDFKGSPETPFDSLTRALLEVEGVEEVAIFVDGNLAGRSTPTGDSMSTEEIQSAGPPGEEFAHAGRDGANHHEFFSLGEVFDPLLADPRWPRFSVAYQNYIRDDELERVGSASFGETFSFVRSPDTIGVNGRSDSRPASSRSSISRRAPRIWSTVTSWLG